MKELPDFQRRHALRAAAIAAVSPVLGACGGGGSFASAIAQGMAAAPASVNQAMADFARMQPQGSHALVIADAPQGSWAAGHQPQQRLFIGSAFKTFVLGQFLRDVEAGRAALDAPFTLDDRYRTGGSPVLGGLSGELSHGQVLEAMIAHSDNTATDIATAQVGVARVRALIAEAGLAQTQIPDSGRRLLSYLAGAPLGMDIGWEGVRQLAGTGSAGYAKRADVVNAQQSILSTADDLVLWYRQALAGRFFAQPATLRDFKRISAMADRLIETAPADAACWGKPGWLDWEGFHALCLAGQVRVNHVPVSFCFTLNWQGGSTTSEDRFSAFTSAIAAVLAEAARHIEAGCR